jgi:hypothetical protein
MKYRFLLEVMGFEEHSGNRIHYRLTSHPTRPSKNNSNKEEKTSLENTDGDRRFSLYHPCLTSGVDWDAVGVRRVERLDEADVYCW